MSFEKLIFLKNKALFYVFKYGILKMLFVIFSLYYTLFNKKAKKRLNRRFFILKKYFFIFYFLKIDFFLFFGIINHVSTTQF